MTNDQNPTGFDIFKKFPAMSDLSPEQQFEYVHSDPEMQQKYLSGDMTARLAFETASKNFVEWQQQQKAAELKKAMAEHSDFLHSVGGALKR